MKIVYMPHRGTLAQALEESRVFDSLLQLQVYLRKQPGLRNSDIFYRFNCYDSRIGRYVFSVLISSFYREDFMETCHYPQCYGAFYFEE